MRNLRKKTIYIFFLEKQTRYPRMLFLNSGERGNEKIGDLSITREKNLLNFYLIPSHGCVPLEFVFHRDYRVPYRRGMEIRGPESHPSSSSLRHSDWTNFHGTTNSRETTKKYTSNEEKNIVSLHVWIRQNPQGLRYPLLRTTKSRRTERGIDSKRSQS